LFALGDDIRALDIDIQMPSACEEAKHRYEQAACAADALRIRDG
jgi:hypothetical protein